MVAGDVAQVSVAVEGPSSTIEADGEGPLRNAVSASLDVQTTRRSLSIRPKYLDPACALKRLAA